MWPIPNASPSGGGIGYTGSKICTSGYCMVYNDCKQYNICRYSQRGSYACVNTDYHQCIPGTDPAPPTTTSTTPTSTPPTAPPSTTVVAPPAGTASGVVSRSGTEFRLNGKKFYFVGCQNTRPHHRKAPADPSNSECILATHAHK